MKKQLGKLFSSVGMAALISMGAMGSGAAHAALTVFQTYFGTYGVSTAGWGSTTQAGTLTANVPAGAVVQAAYLYTVVSRISDFATSGAGGTLNGTSVTYTPLGMVTVAGQAGRTDVTSIVAPVINGGAGGAYNFAITETSHLQEGSALVVVYQLASLPVSTVAILDGFSLPAGDSTSLNFATPLNPAAPGFFAEMRLGIGYSVMNQFSRVTVNGIIITENAGNNDDSMDSSGFDGGLITVGDDNDPFSPMLPSYANDHERYNLVPHIASGSTSIVVDTVNSSLDDLIFLAVFHTIGRASVSAEPPVVGPGDSVTAVPSLSEWGLVVMASLLGLFGLARARRRG